MQFSIPQYKKHPEEGSEAGKRTGKYALQGEAEDAWVV